MKQPEVLAPAGSYESMTAAFAAGADGVYMGGSRFGARAYADNPDNDLLRRAVDYANMRGKKLYLTVNTLMKDRETDDVRSFLKPLYDAGLNGVIVQDTGVVKLIHDEFPGLPIHASTQMTVTTGIWAGILKEYGVTRIVAARELSLQELKSLKEKSGLEIEVFVQGALCYCYSGQCLFSSVIGGRSGNRGRCAQPCRMAYGVMHEDSALNGGNTEYVLSPRDICLLSDIPDLADAGVDSLKIEGRMKGPEYAAVTSYMYRKYVDMYAEKGRDGFRVLKEDMELLENSWSRSGFSGGYLSTRNGREMMTLKDPSYPKEIDSAAQELFGHIMAGDRRIPVSGSLVMKKGEPLSLKVQACGISCEALGKEPDKALKKAVTKEDAEKRIRQTGDSDFVFESLDTVSDDDVFVPVGELKELRRKALNMLSERMLYDFRR